VIGNHLFFADEIPDNLLASLESRDVALWVRELPRDPPGQEVLASFLGLPWRLVLLESYDALLVEVLEAAASFSDPMTRKRGYIQVIDTDPSRIELPQRCLPVYLLRARPRTAKTRAFARAVVETLLPLVRPAAPPSMPMPRSATRAVPP